MKGFAEAAIRFCCNLFDAKGWAMTTPGCNPDIQQNSLFSSGTLLPCKLKLSKKKGGNLRLETLQFVFWEKIDVRSPYLLRFF